MTTADLSLRFDPIYEPISRRFHKNPQQFADAFARAWFKLTHRDMGPKARYLGPEVPAEDLIWQDPVPAVDHPLIDAQGHRRRSRPRSWPRACRSPQLVSTAWASAPPSAARTSAAAPTARASAWRRRRTGKSTSRRNWPRCSATLEGIQQAFNGAAAGGKKVSLADLIVLGGCAAVEAAAKKAGHDVTVPFTPGRTDASQEQTDVESLRRAGAGGRRLPQLPEEGLHRFGRGDAGRQGATADADRAGDDGAGRRPARAGRQRRRRQAWRVHEAARAR